MATAFIVRWLADDDLFNWHEGLQLLSIYLALATGAWFLH
jgi:hypothetical protein